MWGDGKGRHPRRTRIETRVVTGAEAEFAEPSVRMGRVPPAHT
jgi:hypothetical protein